MARPTTSPFSAALQRLAPAAPPSSHDSLTALQTLLGAAPSTATYQLLAPDGSSAPVPSVVLQLLQRVVDLFAQGDALTVLPLEHELTSQQAADLLNVSRQYLVRLLDEGRLPSHKTGTHRRVRLQDLMAFKAQRDTARAASLDQLSHLSQDHEGYPEIPVSPTGSGSS